MITINNKIKNIFIGVSIIIMILVLLFVNLTVNNNFKEYLKNNQSKRNERIVDYLQKIYKEEKAWRPDSGIEMMHEAYMSNFCLTLYDKNKNIIWGMNPKDLKNEDYREAMLFHVQSGNYISERYELKDNDEIIGYIDVGHYSTILMSQEDIKFQVDINKSIIASAVIAIILSIILSKFVSKEFTEPIKKVADISVKLSNGNLDAECFIDTDIKELGELKNSINRLGEKLKYQDVLRKRLVSDISHELRTPLNVLQNNLEAMIDGIFPITGERLESLNDEVIRFAGLLNNLKVLKNFEEDSKKLNFKVISLKRLIYTIYEDFKLYGKEKDVILSFKSFIEEEDYILGDESSLRQVFINILSNAIKFSKEKGKVEIILRKNKEDLIVEISDNGIGIHEEDLPFIFERFYRGDKSREETEGSGIGLTITKSILELHSADIEVKSKENIGTTVMIHFKSI